jgi:hypothetical protein
MRSQIFIIYSAVAAILCSCASSDYVQPQLPADGQATVAGSNIADGTKVRLIKIDGKFTKSTVRDKPIVVTPGTHTLLVSAWNAQNFQDSVSFTLRIDPMKDYVLRAAYPTKVSDNCLSSAVWIETAEGSAATERREIALRRPSRATEMMVGGTYVSVPPARAPQGCS